MNLISYIRLNAWRFTPDSWGDWARHLWSCARERYVIWRFWYSPIWRKTYRCPACAGSGLRTKRGDTYDCEVCHGARVLVKMSGHHTPYWVYRLKRWITSI